MIYNNETYDEGKYEIFTLIRRDCVYIHCSITILLKYITKLIMKTTIMENSNNNSSNNNNNNNNNKINKIKMMREL